MKTRALSLIVAAAGALAGCGGDPSNPPQLWLALNGDELHVKLVDKQPREY
jgi:hypothetical protein